MGGEDFPTTTPSFTRSESVLAIIWKDEREEGGPLLSERLFTSLFFDLNWDRRPLFRNPAEEGQMMSREIRSTVNRNIARKSDEE